MNDDNNVYENNEQPNNSGGPTSYGGQTGNSGEPVRLDKNYQPQSAGDFQQSQNGFQPQTGYSQQSQDGSQLQAGYSQQSQNGSQPQQSGYTQQPYSGEPQQTGYGQQPYGNQNQYTPASGYAEPVYQQESQSTLSAESGGFGIASMICGIIALITCCLWCTCIPLAIVSIVLGILQLSKGTAKGMAIAGIVCSAIALILLLILTVVGVFVQNSPAYYDIMRELQYMNYSITCIYTV